MKNLLFLLFTCLFISCESDEPDLETKGTLICTARYDKPTELGVLYSLAPDNQSTINIFYNKELLPFNLDINGSGELLYENKAVTPDQILTLDQNGKVEYDINNGKFSIVCISKNMIKNNKRAFKGYIVDFTEKRMSLSFEFKH